MQWSQNMLTHNLFKRRLSSGTSALLSAVSDAQTQHVNEMILAWHGLSEASAQDQLLTLSEVEDAARELLVQHVGEERVEPRHLAPLLMYGRASSDLRHDAGWDGHSATCIALALSNERNFQIVTASWGGDIGQSNTSIA